MSRALRPLLQFAWWVLTFRPLRLVAALLFVAWSLHRAVVFATDAAYFSSLGLSETFWQTRSIALGIFFVFFGGALAFSIPFLRASAKPVRGDLASPEIPLRLSFLDDWHARAPKLAWLLVLLGAFWGAHRLENLWPRADTILDATWDFTLLLLLVVALGGGVRALPFLAAKNPVSPARWLRALKILGGLALFLRALGYAQVLAVPEFTGFEFWIGRALAGLGIALVGLAIFQILRGAARRKIAFGVLGALFLPAVAGAILRPFFFWLPSTQPQKPEGTPKTALAIQTPRVPIERGFAVWDERRLVLNARASRPRASETLTDWQNAALFFDGEKWRAGVVGTATASSGTLADLEAESANALEWLALDLGRIEDGSPVVENGFAPARLTFYGLDGPPLFSNDPNLGTSFSGLWKVLWSWRLKAPALGLEGAQFRRILPFRGVAESASLVWSELEWKNARPFWDTRERRWVWLAEGFEGETRIAFVFQNPGDGHLQFRRASQAPPVHWLRAQTLPIFDQNSEPFNGEADLRADDTLNRPENAREIWMGTRKIWDFQLGAAQESFEARLESLDSFAQNRAASEKIVGETGVRLEKGSPVFYPDASAPGGAWVARGFFVVKTENAREAARLWSVVVGAIDSSTVGLGPDTASARRDFELQSRLERAKNSPVAREKLEVQALELQRRAEAAFKAGEYQEWDKQNRRLKAVLEELAKR